MQARDIFIGDAIVSLTLKHYKAATPFLLKQFGRFIPEYTPTFPTAGENLPILPDEDGTSSLPGDPASQPVPDSPCSVDSDGSGSWIGIPRIKKNWIDVVTVPLLMAYTTRYIFGTDKLRPNAFEVRGM